MVLTKEDGTQGTINAEYHNRGANRDAYVLDERRIMKTAPITDAEDHNQKETELHNRIVPLTDVKCLPDVLGSVRTRVMGHEFSWLILERATWTMSDMMLHPKVIANPIH